MSRSNSTVTHIYYLSLVLLMLKSMMVCWLWSVPEMLLDVFALIFTIITAVSTDIYKFNSKLKRIIIIYFAFVCVVRLSSSTLNIATLIWSFFRAAIIIGVICLKDEFKRDLFKCFCKTLSVILIISIPAWLLFLAGVPFSSGPAVDLGDGFHYIYNYKFFIVSYGASFHTFPRFASVFLEPGWIGTICCFVLFGLRFNKKEITTYLCLLGLLLSVSLSAIVNLTVCGVLWILFNNKHKWLTLSLMFLSLSGIFYFGSSYNNGNNRINELIIDRLVFDEDLGIAGNNRTTEDFENYFKEVMTGPNKWFGINYLLTGEFLETNEWFSRSSGIKKDLIMYGIVGTGLFVLFLFLLFFYYKSKECLVFLVCFLLASFVRNLWHTECYLILFIVIMSYLHRHSQKYNDCVGNAVLIKG